MRLFRFTALALGCLASLAAAPAITTVYNGASWTPPSLPNSGIAQGSIFTLTGTGLGPATLQQVTAYPLPTTQGLGGTTIQVKVGGVTISGIMIYTSATQVAAILPSSTPVGTGTLTLTYQSGASSIAITVLAANFGTFTLNEGGSGPGVVTDTSYNAITYINPAFPGETLILWGTGLGAVTGDETEPPAQVDLGTGVQVLIGNQPATVLYGGRGSSPGLDQINFTVPAGVTGCKTSVAVSVKGVTGNITMMAIAPAGQSTCGDTFGPFTTGNLQKAISSGSLNVGTVTVSRVGTGDDTLVAEFKAYDLNSLLRSYGSTIGPSIGSCISYEVVGGTTLSIIDPIEPPRLDAGAQISITAPGKPVANVAASATGTYTGTLGTSSNVFMTPGAYSATNGSGGTAVGAFNWSATLPSPVVPSGLPSTFNRAQNLTLSWSNSSPFSLVTIFIFTAVPLTSTTNSYVELVCDVAASASQFTVPSQLLSMLPTNGYGAFGVPGVGIQIAGVVSDRFTVAGSPGLDAGIFSLFTSTGSVVKVQ
jgi:uncharacterized protein (TIGR03437 family)